MANVNNPAQINNEIAFSQQVINIGKKPGNDIILTGDSVADFHAMLSYGDNTWTLIPLDSRYPVFLGNKPVDLSGTVVRSGANITIGDYRLKLLLNGINTDFVVSELRSTSAGSVTDSSTERYILLNLDGTVPTQADPGTTVEYDLQITNAGPLVANMQLQVQGVPNSWVQVVPAVLNLNEGKRGDMIVRITPPRSAEAKAGNYAIHFVCLSPNYPGEIGTADANLQVMPFYEYIISGPNPRRQQIKRNAPVGHTSVTISNRSNADMNFMVHAYDDANELNFGINDSAMTVQSQNAVSVPAGQKMNVPLAVTTKKLPVFGWFGHSRHFYVNTASQENPLDQQSLIGEVYVKPMISTLWLILMILALVLGLGILLQPNIHYFRDSNDDQVEVIFSGGGTDLSWSASIFAAKCSLLTESVDSEPVTETVSRNGHKYCRPDSSTTYTLTAENFLSRLLGLEYTKEVRVIVVPTRPDIPLFKTNLTEASYNDTAKITWSVDQDADYAALNINKQKIELKAEDYSAERDVVLDGDTLIALQVSNEAGYEEKSVFINVKPNKIDLVKFTAWVRPNGIAIPNDNDTRRATRWSSITALNSLSATATPAAEATLRSAGTRQKPFAQSNTLEIPDDFLTGNGMTQNINPEQQLQSAQIGTARYQNASTGTGSQDLLVSPGMATPVPAPVVSSINSPSVVTGTAVPSTSPESQSPNSEFTVKLVEVVEDTSAESGYRVIDYFPDYVLQPKEQILIEWEVEDANSVAIEQLADRGRKAIGAEYDFPEASTNYVLTATLGDGNKIFSLPIRVAGDSDDGEGSGLNCALSSNSTKLETPGSVMLNWTGAGNNRVQIVSSAKAESDYNKSEAEKAKKAAESGSSYTSPQNGEMSGGIIGDYLQPSGFMRVNVSKQTSFVLNAYDGNNNIICSKTVKVEVTDGDDKNDLTFKIVSAEDAEGNVRTITIDDKGTEGFGKYMVGEKVFVRTEFSKTITGKDPTGTITISDGYTSCTATLPVTGCQLTTTHAGNLRLTAIYNGDSNYKKATSKGWLYVVSDKIATTTTITSAENNPDSGIVFTTKLGWKTDSGLYSGQPTGTIDFVLTFEDESVKNCTYTIASKTSTCGSASVSGNLTDGILISGWKPENTTSAPKTIAASYSGDTYFAASVSDKERIKSVTWDLTLTFAQPQYRDYYDINKTSGKYYPSRIDLVSEGTTPYNACNPYDPTDQAQDVLGCTEIKNKSIDIILTAADDAPLSTLVGQTLSIYDSDETRQTCTIAKSDSDKNAYHCVVDFTFQSTGMKTLYAAFEGSTFFKTTAASMEYVNVIRLETGNEKATKTEITVPVSGTSFVTNEIVPVTVKVTKSLNNVEVETGNVMVYAYEYENSTKVLSSCEIDGYKKGGTNTCTLSFKDKSAGQYTTVIVAEYAGTEDYKPSASKTHITVNDAGSLPTTLDITKLEPASNAMRKYNMEFTLAYDASTAGSDDRPTGSILIKKGSGGSGNQCSFDATALKWYEAECESAEISYLLTTQTYTISNLPFSSMKKEDVTVTYSGDEKFTGSSDAEKVEPTQYELQLTINEPLLYTYFDISGANSRYYPQDPSKYTDPFGHCNPYTEGSADQKDCVKLTDSADVKVGITLPDGGDKLPKGTIVTVTDGTSTCEAELKKDLAVGTIEEVSCNLKFTTVGKITLSASYAGNDCYKSAQDSLEPYYAVNLPDPENVVKTQTAILSPKTGSVFTYENVVTFRVKVTDADGNDVAGPVLIYSENREILGSGYYNGDPDSPENDININMTDTGYQLKFYAEYAGAGSYASSVSEPIVLDILSPIRGGTTLSITSPTNASTVTTNEPYTVSVSLINTITSDSILHVAQGTITVTDDFGGKCSITLPIESETAAECTFTPTLSGTIYTLQASYSGDSLFKPAVSSNVKVKTVDAAKDECTLKITNIKIYNQDNKLYDTTGSVVYADANRSSAFNLNTATNTVIKLDTDRASYYTYDLERSCTSGKQYPLDGIVTMQLWQQEKTSYGSTSAETVIDTGKPGQVSAHSKLSGAGEFSTSILISQNSNYFPLYKEGGSSSAAYFTGELELKYSGDSHYPDTGFVKYGQDSAPYVYLDYGGTARSEAFYWRIIDIRDSENHSHVNAEVESGKAYSLVVLRTTPGVFPHEYEMTAEQSTMCYDRTASANPCSKTCTSVDSYCVVPIGFIEPGVYRPELSLRSMGTGTYKIAAGFTVTVKGPTVTPSVKVENVYYSGSDCSTRTYEDYSEDNLPRVGNGLRMTIGFELSGFIDALNDGDILASVTARFGGSRDLWAQTVGDVVYKDGKVQDVVFEIPTLPLTSLGTSSSYTLSISFNSLSPKIANTLNTTIRKDISVDAGVMFLYPSEAAGADIVSNNPVYRWVLSVPDSSYAEHDFYAYLARGKVLDADDPEGTSDFTCKIPLTHSSSLDYSVPDLDKIYVGYGTGIIRALSECRLYYGDFNQIYYRCSSSSGGSSLTADTALNYTLKNTRDYMQPQGYYVDIVVGGGDTPSQGLAIKKVTGDGSQLQPSADLKSSVTVTYTKSSSSEADPAGTITITGSNTTDQVVTKTINIAESCKLVSDTVLSCADIEMPAYTYGGLYTYTAVYSGTDGKGKQEVVYDQYVYIKPIALVYDPNVSPAYLDIADYNADDNCNLVWRAETERLTMSAGYVWTNPSDAAKAYYAGSALKLTFNLKLGGSGSTAVFTEEEAAALQKRLEAYLYIYDSKDNPGYAAGEVSVQANSGIVVVTFLLDDAMFPIGGNYKLSLEVEDPESKYACFDNQDGIIYHFLGVKPSALVLAGANGTDFTVDETGLNYTWKADFTALTGSTVNFTVKVMQGNQPRCLANFTVDDYPVTPSQLNISTTPQNVCSWVENKGLRQLRCTENWDTNTISYWQSAGESAYDYTLYNNVTPPTVSEIKVIPENTASTSGSGVTMTVSLEP